MHSVNSEAQLSITAFEATAGHTVRSKRSIDKIPKLSWILVSLRSVLASARVVDTDSGARLGALQHENTIAARQHWEGRHASD